MILFEGLGGQLVDYFQSPAEYRYIVCPFISLSTAKKLLKDCTGQVFIVTSWRMDHLRSGVSSLDLYDFCKEHNHELYVIDELHAKFYSNDLKSAFAGSANLTNRGLGYHENPNLELLVWLESLAPHVRIWVHGLLAKATRVDERVFEWYQANIGEVEPRSEPELPQLPPQLKEDSFLITQLPASDSPTRLWELLKDPDSARDLDELARSDHDLGLYSLHAQCTNIDEFRLALKDPFLSHPFIRAFTKLITRDGFPFGPAKIWIQDNCTEVPRPWRKELTEPVQRLFSWLPELAPDTFVVKRPVYRQVIYREPANFD